MSDEPTIDQTLAEVRRKAAEQQQALPLAYVSVLPIIIRVGRSKGYTIAVHGSLQRDLDLVAVPWVAEAVPAHELVEAVVAAVGGFIVERPRAHAGVRDPEQKPHNRLAWSIHLGGGPYIDLSVTPRCTGCGASTAIA